VSSSSANGSITYVEYSFALSVNYPVVKVLNSAGFYTLPTQFNVAVALEDAQINTDPNSPDYLLQNLTDVYTDPDPRTYPLSSYVYMIEPTGTYPNPESKITTAKRQSIADFEYYSICQGQKEIGPIGYSPLPVNLVEAGFGQIQRLQQADPGVDLTQRNILTCDNPTFVPGQPNANYLAQIAPQPPACDRTGTGPCAAGVTPNGVVVVTPDAGAPGSSSSAATGSAGSAAAATAVGGSSPAASARIAAALAAQSTSAAKANAVAAAAAAAPHPVPATLAAFSTSSSFAVAAPVVVVLLLLIFGLPLFFRYRRSRRPSIEVDP
jgi:hypothetical protein